MMVTFRVACPSDIIKAIIFLMRGFQLGLSFDKLIFLVNWKVRNCLKGVVVQYINNPNRQNKKRYKQEKYTVTHHVHPLLNKHLLMSMYQDKHLFEIAGQKGSILLNNLV